MRSCTRWFLGANPYWWNAMERIRIGFIPVLERMPGFVVATAVACDDGKAYTLWVFEKDEQARAAERAALAWSETHLADLAPYIVPSPIIHGDVVIYSLPHGFRGRG